MVQASGTSLRSLRAAPPPPDLQIHTLGSELTGHRSHLVQAGKVAVVVEPSMDTLEELVALARSRDTHVAAILATCPSKEHVYEELLVGLGLRREAQGVSMAMATGCPGVGPTEEGVMAIHNNEGRPPRGRRRRLLQSPSASTRLVLRVHHHPTRSEAVAYQVGRHLFTGPVEWPVLPSAGPLTVYSQQSTNQVGEAEGDWVDLEQREELRRLINEE